MAPRTPLRIAAALALLACAQAAATYARLSGGLACASRERTQTARRPTCAAAALR